MNLRVILFAKCAYIKYVKSRLQNIDFSHLFSFSRDKISYFLSDSLRGILAYKYFAQSKENSLTSFLENSRYDSHDCRIAGCYFIIFYTRTQIRTYVNLSFLLATILQILRSYKTAHPVAKNLINTTILEIYSRLHKVCFTCEVFESNTKWNCRAETRARWVYLFASCDSGRLTRKISIFP